MLDAIRRTPLGLTVCSGHVGIARFLVRREPTRIRSSTNAMGLLLCISLLKTAIWPWSASSLRSVPTKMRPTILEELLEEHRCIEHLKQTIWTLSAFLWSRVPVVTQPTKMHPTTAIPKWFAFCLSLRQNPSRKVPRSAVTVRHSPTSWR